MTGAKGKKIMIKTCNLTNFFFFFKCKTSFPKFQFAYWTLKIRDSQWLVIKASITDRRWLLDVNEQNNREQRFVFFHIQHFKCNLHNSQTIFPTVEWQENVQHSNANILGIL